MKILTKVTLFIFTFLVCFKASAQRGIITIDDRTQLPTQVYDTLKQYGVIFLGEMHGTNEAPQFIEGFARLWERSGEKVIIALEIPTNNQVHVDKYMESGNSKIIDKMPFFNSYNDGRQGEAMATLIKNLYGLKNVKIFCFDTADETLEGQDRDNWMAGNLLSAMKNNPGYKIISLSGNIHSMIKKGFGNRPAYMPMAYLLSLESEVIKRRAISLNIHYGQGTAFNCMNNDCKERVMDESTYGSSIPSENFMSIDFSLKERIGCYGVLFSKKITASMPLHP